MYIPEIYKNDDHEEILEFVRNNSFGILINQNLGKIFATHIPLELEKNDKGKDILVGHVSIENPQWIAFKNNNKILAIFSGANTYISPSWYDHENVPTWNYSAVHVSGNLKIISREKTLDSLKKLVSKYESTVENPTSFDDYSKKTLMQVRSIIGFEITITKIEAIKKMSQNRDDKNFNRIVANLEKSDNVPDNLVAAEMKKCPR